MNNKSQQLEYPWKKNQPEDNCKWKSPEEEMGLICQRNSMEASVGKKGCEGAELEIR